jgi:chorismate mutase/prephenate dehydrogenase
MSIKNDYRERITQLDNLLLSILAQRLDIAFRIGEIKRKNNESIIDTHREEEVKNLWIKEAIRLGLPVPLVEAILTQIFIYSRLKQVEKFGDPKILFIGYGKMATNIGSFFSSIGYKVGFTGKDINKAKMSALNAKGIALPPSEGIEWADLVFIALRPSALFSDFFNNIINKCKGKIVMDIFSVKGEFYDVLASLADKIKFDYISLHPLFGPLRNPIGETMVLIPHTRNEAIVNHIKTFLLRCGFKVVLTTRDDHDRIMALVQVAHHFVIKGLSKFLDKVSRESNINLNDFFTHSLKETLSTSSKIDDDTFIEIQKKNPYANKVREEIIRYLIELNEELKNLASLNR